MIDHFGAGLTVDHDRARDAVGGGRRAVGDPDGGDGVVGRQGARPHPRGGGELERGEARGADRLVHVRAGGGEEFFTPYLWAVVFDQSAIGWAAARVMLFPVVGTPVDAAPDVSGLPLMRVDVDVDEGAHEAAPAGWPAVQPTTSFEGGV